MYRVIGRRTLPVIRSAPPDAARFMNRPKLPLVDSRKSDQVDAGQRTANLLHLAASDEIAEVDGDEACVLEQCDHFGLRVDVVAGKKDHSLAPSLVGICAEDRSAEGLRGLTTRTPPTRPATSSLEVLPSRSPGSKSLVASITT